MNTKKKMSPDQVRASMGISNPKPAVINSATAIVNTDSKLLAEESIIRLHIDSIIPYKRNPRRKINERYVEIRESIRVRGIDNMVKVTKRPGEDLYFPAAGGNTRILAQKELYAEPGGERFAYIDCLFTEYKSEADVLTRHIIENDTRADLVFWDKANAILELTKEIEAEMGKPVSGRQLAEILTERGIQIGREVLRTYIFANEKLGDLGAATAGLSKKNVRDFILPTYQKLMRLAEKLTYSAATFHDSVAKPIFRKAEEKYLAVQEFNVDVLCSDMVDATATVLGQDVDGLRRMLSILEQAPDTSKEELTAPAPIPTSADVSNSPESIPSSEDTADSDDAGESPSNVRTTTSNAGLGTGKSTEVLFASNLIPGNHTRQAQEDSNKSLDFVESGAETEQSQSSDNPDDATLLTVSQTNTGHDLAAKARFMSRLCAFSQIVNLQESIRFDDTFPLWFYVDLPVPDKESIPLDIESQAGGNPYRYVAWWYLAGLCGVLEDGSTARANLPIGSGISIAIADDDKWDDEIRNTIGEPLYEGTLGQLVTWLSDPDNPAGESLLGLLGALREVRAAGARGEPT